MDPDVLELLECPFSGTDLVLEGEADWGVLRSEAGAFPVLAGIPILRLGEDELVELVEAGEHERAVRTAAFAEVAPSGWRRIGPWLAATERLGAPGRRLQDSWRADLDRRARPLTDPGTTTEDLFALAYRELRLRNPEVFAYNWYRYSVPRHLAALAAMAWAPPTGPVLDLGCGAGHLTAALDRHVAPDPVIGVDGLFFALYVARTRVAPGAQLVCCDLDPLPLRDGVVGGVWASDVLHAIARKASVARELHRVAGPRSWGAVVSLAVAGHDHEYPGRPLSLDGYRRLLGPGATFLADDAQVEGYLAGHAADRSAPGDPAAAPTVTALWVDGLEAADGAGFTGWPHAQGELGLNPLFVADGREGDATRVVRRWPTPAYEREHGALRAYVPEEALVPDDRTGAELDRLIEQFVVLGFPEGYLEDPWPDGG
jgi:SAM-dependent methyltransferase